MTAPHDDPRLHAQPTPAQYAARQHRAAQAARDAGLAGLLVGTGADLAYLTGYSGSSHERLTALLLRHDAAPVVVVPTLERPGWVGGAAEASGVEFRAWDDHDGPYALVAHLAGSGALGVDDHLAAAHLFGLMDSGVQVVRGGRVLAALRSVKDAAELDALAGVADAIDRVQARMGEFLIAGRSEAEVADAIAAAIVEEGHAHPDFVIVGSGPNGASPHHESSERVIVEGDVVVVDIGGPAASGYNSDTTRTYIVGEPSDPEAARVHRIVQEAQAAGVEAAVAGATCASVDAAARAVIEAAGYGDFFITRTGHGIGLEVHEHPYLVAGNDEPLRPGMAFSVEPGIYLPGRFGVRIEDIVVVDEAGLPRPLNRTTHGWTLPVRA